VGGKVGDKEVRFRKKKGLLADCGAFRGKNHRKGIMELVQNLAQKGRGGRIPLLGPRGCEGLSGRLAEDFRR